MRKTILLLAIISLISCSREEKKKDEHLTIDEFNREAETDSVTGLKPETNFTKVPMSPGNVLMTGMNRYRLVPIYKVRSKSDRNLHLYEESTYYGFADEKRDEDEFHYFMPGIDIVHGYNLINIGHYDVDFGKLSYFFDRPSLSERFTFRASNPIPFEWNQFRAITSSHQFTIRTPITIPLSIKRTFDDSIILTIPTRQKQGFYH